MVRLRRFEPPVDGWAAGVGRGGMVRGLRCGAAAAALWLAAVSGASAQMEFHYQFGRLANPYSGEQRPTSILTLQQAAGWSYGDSFFFIDILDDDKSDGFNDKDFYGEWYPTLSLGKLAGRTVGGGPLRDVAFIGGVNFDGDADVLKWLPGVRLSWDVPGFLFLNTDVTAFLDANDGVTGGGAAPRTGDTFMFDVNWGAVFDIGSQSFLFTGHAEYIGATTDELGGEVKSWVLAQPQFTWDLSKALNGTGNEFFVGVEYQYWGNKLGWGRHGASGDDNVAQFLVIWRL